MSLAEAFDQLRAALENAGIRYAVGGSCASTAFGEPRFTNDVDLVADVTPQKLDRFFNCLSKKFYADAGAALTAIVHGKPFNLIFTSHWHSSSTCSP